MNTAISAQTSHLAQVFAQYPIEVLRGEGVWLYARDGRKYLDFYGGHAVAALGYGHPRWLAALERQARQIAFQTNALPMPVRERAAARLVRFSGLALPTVFWVNSGAEANENALKLACKFTGRQKIVALEHGFHGRTAAASAVNSPSESPAVASKRRFPVCCLSNWNATQLTRKIPGCAFSVLVNSASGPLKQTFVRS